MEFKAAMRDFSTMFPTLDAETIETVLRSNNGAVDATIDQLLEMCDSMGLSSSLDVNGRVPATSSRRTNSPVSQRQANQTSTHLAVDNVDSYNLHLASVTPPKHESVFNDPKMYANLPFQENHAPSPTAKEATSYRYQTALYKFNNPFLGPLPDDFLRIKNDEAFDRAMQYSRQKRRQVEDIKNERLHSSHYIQSDSTNHPSNDFEQVVSTLAVTPISEEPSAGDAWGASDAHTYSAPATTINPSSGEISCC